MAGAIARRLGTCVLLAALLPSARGLRYVGNVSVSPSQSQLEWHSWEVGVMITFNMQTWCLPKGGSASAQQCQKGGPKGPLYVPDWPFVRALDPQALDTDAWMDAAASFGAKYAVLVVDHMTGFALWPTAAHNFSIASTAWKNGTGDVVSDFLSSCARTGIAPGMFYSTHYNWYLGVNDYAVGWPRLYGGPSLSQTQYEDVVLAQLAELAAYGPGGVKRDGRGRAAAGAGAVEDAGKESKRDEGMPEDNESETGTGNGGQRYAMPTPDSENALHNATTATPTTPAAATPTTAWREVWFDGGVNTVLTPRVGPAVRQLFPTALCHSCVNFTQASRTSGAGTGYGLRWMGDEEGVMPLPSWGATSVAGYNSFGGDPTADLYIPPSADTVLSEHYWFWQPSYGTGMRSTCALVNVYLTSVGRAANLILNMAPNSTGGLDEADTAAYRALGQAVQCLWSRPLGQVLGVSIDADTGVAVIPLPQPVLPTTTSSSSKSGDGSRDPPQPSNSTGTGYGSGNGSWDLSLHLQEDMNATGQRIGQWTVEACVAQAAAEYEGEREGGHEARGHSTGSLRGPAAQGIPVQPPEADCAGTWQPLFTSLTNSTTTGIGNKRILRVQLNATAPGQSITALRFTAVTAYLWRPQAPAAGMPPVPDPDISGEPALLLSRVALYDWYGAEQRCVPQSEGSAAPGGQQACTLVPW